MFSLSSTQRYFLYDRAADMRKGFDGLCGLVRSGMGRDPLSGEVYIFLNRAGTLIKLLHWEAGGLVLYYKRLEKGTFQRPVQSGQGGNISWTQLVLMVEGIKILDSRQIPRYAR